MLTPEFIEDKGITDWLSVSNLDPLVSLDAVGTPGTWPRTNDAIILMQSQSTENPFTMDSNGFMRPNLVNRYYPVVDWIKRLVKDTKTGSTLSLIEQPVSGWASYTIAPKPSIYDRSNVKVHDDDYPGIEYERFPNPRRMYVSKTEGANKVDFGRSTNWNDIGKSAVGHVDYGTEIYILGQARHPMPPNGGVFYMDAAAMGTFSATGRAADTHGYSKTDLNDHLFAPTVVEQPEQVEVPVTNLQIIEPEIPEPSASFKDTYKAFRDRQGRLEIRRYVATNIPKDDIFYEIVSQNGKDVEVGFAWVHDYATQRPPHKFKVQAEVDLAGWFIFGSKFYGRPARVVTDGQWFGIDMDWLVLKSELYSTDTTVLERKQIKTLKARDYISLAQGHAEAAFNRSFDVVRRIRKQKIK